VAGRHHFFPYAVCRGVLSVGSRSIWFFAAPPPGYSTTECGLSPWDLFRSAAAGGSNFDRAVREPGCLYPVLILRFGETLHEVAPGLGFVLI